jgi:di/tripeptidase
LKAVVNDASQKFWGTNYVGIGTGGSVPMMNFLQEKWPNTDFISTGLMGPGSNAHGPDECLDIKFMKQFTGAISYIVA